MDQLLATNFLPCSLLLISTLSVWLIVQCGAKKETNKPSLPPKSGIQVLTAKAANSTATAKQGTPQKQNESKLDEKKSEPKVESQKKDVFTDDKKDDAKKSEATNDKPEEEKEKPEEKPEEKEKQEKTEEKPKHEKTVLLTLRAKPASKRNLEKEKSEADEDLDAQLYKQNKKEPSTPNKMKTCKTQTLES